MKITKDTWWVVILVALLPVAGNLITVFGPKILSYGTIPDFVKDPTYKKLNEQYGLNDRLNNIFLKATEFNTKRLYELTFVDIQEGKLIQHREITTGIYRVPLKIRFNFTLF